MEAIFLILNVDVYGILSWEQNSVKTQLLPLPYSNASTESNIRVLPELIKLFSKDRKRYFTHNLH